MPEVKINNEEFERLAEKLDGLADQLSDDEKTVLLAVFRSAGEAMSREAGEGVVDFAEGRSGVLEIERPPGALPDLSDGFVGAFTGGRPGGAGQDLAQAPEVTGTIKIGVAF